MEDMSDSSSVAPNPKGQPTSLQETDLVVQNEEADRKLMNELDKNSPINLSKETRTKEHLGEGESEKEQLPMIPPGKYSNSDETSTKGYGEGHQNSAEELNLQCVGINYTNIKDTNELKEKSDIKRVKIQSSELVTNLEEDVAKARTLSQSDMLYPAKKFTYIVRGIGVIFITLGISCLIASLAITYPILLPMVEKIMFANLTITNITQGFSFNTIEDAPNVTWYFWNISNHVDFVAGTSPPSLKQLGPYVLHQKMRTFAANFSDDGKEVYRSSAIFGEYIASESCAMCSLDDRITMVNNVYLYFTGLYASESQLLQQYIPNVIRNDLNKIAGYLKTHGYTGSTAQANSMALQQWAECSILNSASIRQKDSSWFYYPELCGWAQYVEGIPFANISTADASGILYDSSYALLKYRFGDAFAIENLQILVYPRGLQNAPQKLPKLDITQTLTLMDYVSYLTLYATKAYFEDVILQNSGLFITRTVQEIIFGYYDPILESYYGNKTQLAFVGAINNIDLINKNPEIFIEYGGYTGLKTGKDNAKEMFSMVQQGTNMGLKAPVVNKRVIDWEYGSIVIYGSSGSFFGSSMVQKDDPQIMWMDLLNRHIVLDYVEAYTLDNLDIYRYHLSDFSLQACDQLPSGIIEEEGPCIYPQYFQGLFNLTRFMNLYYITLPHFLRADPELKYTLGPAGQDMSNDPLWDMTIDIEPFWGASISVSMMFQTVISLKRTDILRPNLWLNTSSSMFPNTIWLPINIIATQITPNETLIHSLWVGKYFIYAVIFFLVDFVPFFAIACMLCGLHFLWRKSCNTQDRSKEREVFEEDIPIAAVIDPIELQIDQCTLARVIPSFEQMLAELERLRNIKTTPTSQIPSIEDKTSSPPGPLSWDRLRKLSILVEEETMKVARPKSPRGSKTVQGVFVKPLKLSTHASFFIHNHERQSILEMRKSHRARSSKLGKIQEAFVEGLDLKGEEYASSSSVSIDIVPKQEEPQNILLSSALFFEPSKKYVDGTDQKPHAIGPHAIGPALLGDISPRE